MGGSKVSVIVVKLLDDEEHSMYQVQPYSH